MYGCWWRQRERVDIAERSGLPYNAERRAPSAERRAPSAERLTALRAREHRRPPSSPDRLPPRRGGHSSPYAVTAVGRPAGFARLAGARRALSRSARAVAAVACLCLAGAFALPAVQADTTDNGPHGTEHTHFYLWRTTMTVGESSGQLGYNTAPTNSYGSISTDADFNYPPWSPPPKHHFDPDYNFTVDALFLSEPSGVTVLTLTINDVMTISGGTATLWIGNTGFPLNEGAGLGSLNFSSLTDHDLDVPDLDWEEDEEVRVALVYERRLPSAPKNVRVTAPPGEGGTLEVSWDEPDDEGTFPIECYLVEFRHPSGEAKKRKQSYPGSLGPGKGCGDSPPTSVTRTDLETGAQYQVLVQALSGDGFSEWSETKTVRTNGIPTSCVLNPGDLWCGVVTVGLAIESYGFNDFQGFGDLSEKDFDFGANSYTIEAIIVDSQTTATPGALTFTFDSETRPTPAERDNLVLHVGGAAFEFSDPSSLTAGRNFKWNDAGLDWSGKEYVIVRLREASSASRSLRAWFESPPERHDGKKRVRVQVAFSERIDGTPENVGEHGVDVDGGRVTSVRPVGGNAPGGAGNRSAGGRNAGREDREVVWEFEIEPDSDGDLTVSLDAGRPCDEPGAICTADGRSLSEGIATTVEGPDTGPAGLTAAFEGMPQAHDGEGGFRFRVAFSENIGISYRSLREDAFTVTGGRVTGGERVDDRRDLFEITVQPDSDDDVTITLPAGRECSVSGAICTKGEPRRQLTNSPSATVAGPSDDAPEPNTPATGALAIGGTPQVGEALSASTSGISDADGLDDARFAYQWIRADSDIQGATGSTYTAVAADEGRRLKVRVGFTDDAGHAESLTSAATDAVAARPVPLTASFEGMPAGHRGEGGFHFRVAFSEDIGISSRSLREDAFAVTGGRVTGGKRVGGRRDLFRMTVRPDSDAAVTITLPAGRECGVSGAICSKSEPRRQLTNRPSARVRGPVGISVADARVEEEDGAVLVFLVTLSRAAGGTLVVDYATSDGSAQAGVDYTAASGRLSFRTGESSKKIKVGVLDDAHDEGEETLTLTLSNASGGRLTDGDATGTIENRDPLPRALLARFGRTAAVHVVEHVEERLQAPREPGFRGRFAGRELRRGMEREMALNFLRQLGGAAGAGPMGTGPMGAGVGGPMGGSPAAGTAPPGMQGAAGGGALMMGAGGPMSGAAGMAGGGASLQARGLGAAGFGGGAPMGAGPAGGPPGTAGGLNGGGDLRMGLGGGDLLTGSDFAMNRESHGGILSFWSRGAQSRFSGREGALSLGGDVRTTMFGADYARGPVVAGLSLSNSRGLGHYAGAAGGQVASSVTGLYPWLGYQATERVTVWGVAGYGTGGLLLTPDGGQALESGLSMAMAAAGTRGELVAGGASDFGLAFKADALWVGTAIDGVDGPAGRLKATDAAVTRFRTGLEGSRAYTLGGRLSLTPSVEAGLRHDGGDAETGAGMDVGAGLVVSDAGTGLAVDVRVRTLLVHQDEDFSERGVSLSLSYNPTPSTPLGFVARVAPSWGGQATSGAQALWGRETMAGMAHGGVAQGNRLDGEVGYGLPVGRRFVGTPRIGFSTSEYGQDYRVGYGLGVLDRESLAFELGVEAQRRNSPLLGGTSNGMLGRATLGW